MDAVICRIIDMPVGVKGLTVLDSEGDYNVYINARLSAGQRGKAFKHEIEHIRKGDFYRMDSVKDIEADMHT